MKTIIAGSRSVDSLDVVAAAVEASMLTVSEVVSGTAKGVDQLGEAWALQNAIPVSRFKPDWKRFGRAAGLRRNEDMAAYADALIAVWDGKSRGTEHMIATAKQHDLSVFVQRV